VSAAATGKGEVKTMLSSTLFSSKKLDWETPLELFEALDREFGFDLDVCATADNAKCARYYTPEQDGLKQRWEGVCWMNPPYGRDIGKWIRKAYEESLRGATVVCLVPSRTDTSWWHDYCLKGEIRYIRGRLRFSGARVNAPFPSAIVIFRPDGCRG
jgi:phage N-6-adenine-methyltransferase